MTVTPYVHSQGCDSWWFGLSGHVFLIFVCLHTFTTSINTHGTCVCHEVIHLDAAECGQKQDKEQ